MLINGWEFFILNPFESEIKQDTQDKYIDMYNKAYDTFIKQLCIPEPNEILEDGYSFTYYIELSGENDKIDLEESYDYTFLKSVFLDKKLKRIRRDVISYYRMHNVFIQNMYKQDKAFYLVLNK
tara:strand:+ start:128 stop:499 length:372 start_codon:yes stop_codon:yes gene_type:complete